MSLDYTFRALDGWPQKFTEDRPRSPFKAGWRDTLDLLDRELGYLHAERIVIEIALRPGDIRRDGRPRENARQPEHPGVIVSFDSRFGPLRYLTDAFDSGWSGRAGYEGWKANVRAIALGLEALRRVDRYGISRRGEQYRGWNALPSGIAMPEQVFTVADAARFIIEQAGTRWHGDEIESEVENFLGDHEMAQGSYRQRAYRFACKRAHPDTGGDTAVFQRLQEAWAVIVASEA